MAKDFLRGRSRFSSIPLQFVLMFFAVFAGDSAAPVNAQSPTDQAPAAAFARPVFTIIVTRHGVRSISKTPRQYDWADWGWDPPRVNPADLTKHGYQLMVMMGQFYRDEGLAQGSVDCAKKNAYVYADKDQRTLFTAQALVEGLCGAPDALPIYHEQNMSDEDPMFDAEKWLAGVINPKGSADAVKAVAGDPASKIVNSHAGDFSQLQRLLDTRCPADNCEPVWAGESEINTPEKGLAGLGGPLATASSFAEDLFLEYAQCRSLEGITSDPYIKSDLQAAMRLHVLAYDVNARNSYNPRVRGGTLFAHIVAMLADKSSTPWTGVKIPDLSGKTLVIFSGHDTELGSLGGILDAHWEPGGSIVADDMPPGSALIFDLLGGPGAGYRVRLRFAAMTVQQFRTATRLAGDRGVRTTPVVFDGCTMKAGECTAPLANFVTAAESLVGEKFVDPDWGDPQSGIPERMAVPGDPKWTQCGA